MYMAGKLIFILPNIWGNCWWELQKGVYVKYKNQE